MFGENGVGVSWITDLVTAVTSILTSVMEPPLSYFVILGMVAIVARLIRKFVRMRKA